MGRAQKAILASLIATSAIAWLASIKQPDMMLTMTTYNPLSISLFAASWTVGMAAMMFPAITPMVLLYNRFLTTNKQNSRLTQSSIIIQDENNMRSSPAIPLRVILFIGCYLLVWSLSGIALLLGWSIIMNSTIMAQGNAELVKYIYGALLIMAGIYQFTPLKRTCIGYCESPLSFFMHRWRGGTSGAIKLGLYHGMYCLGCCWPYFLLMVALGWMNVLWMGLFAILIFGEKMWSKGLWVARAAGVGIAITGILVISGMLTSLVSSAKSMGSESGSDMASMNNGINHDSMAMAEKSSLSSHSGNSVMMSDSVNSSTRTFDPSQSSNLIVAKVSSLAIMTCLTCIEM